jgi:DNA primase
VSITSGQSDVDLVREATDLVQLIGEHLALTPRGREHVGVCPFHDDHKPSMTVVTHKGNAFYKCHSCGAAGDAFSFVTDYHKMDFPSALRFLADRAGITLRGRSAEDTSGGSGPTRTQLRQANAFAADHFRRTLAEPGAGETARRVLAERSITAESIETFGLGVAPDAWDGLAGRLAGRAASLRTAAAAGLVKARKTGSGWYDTFRNRIVFPICDETGQPVAFGGRRIDPDDEPKYLNSPESPLFRKSRTLYGLHLARRAIIDAGRAVVVEGYTDVITCHQADVRHVVGTLGTALTRDHARILSRLCDEVVLVFDGDEAGQRAADQAIRVFFAVPVDVRICVLPSGCDPDELLRRPDGRAQLLATVDAAEDALAYKLARFRGDLAAAAGLSARQKRLEAFLAELAELGFGAMPGVRKHLVLASLAELFGMTPEEIDRLVPQDRRPRSAGPAPERGPSGESAPGRVGGLYEDDAAADMVRAHRVAEHELLGLLLYEPAAGAAEAGDTRLVDAFDPADFRDDATRRIAAVILPWLRAGEAFTMQRLLAELAEPGLRSVASSLYFEGERRCDEDPGQAVEHAVVAADVLRRHVERRQYEQSMATFRRQRAADDQSLHAADDLIRRRREQGNIASAIPTGVRASG